MIMTPQLMASNRLGNAVAETTPMKANPGLEQRGGIGRQVEIGLWGAGLILLLSGIFDLSVLWLLQRVASPQWELMAIANTITAFPGLVLALAVLSLALYLRRAGGLWGIRILAGASVLLGLAGGALGLLMILDFFVLRGVVSPDALTALWSTTLKTVLLGGLYMVVLVPVGILQLKSSRRKSA
jgi:hypothetical protein